MKSLPANNNQSVDVSLTGNVTRVPVVKINGNHCIVMPDQTNEGLTVIPLGKPVDTSGEIKYTGDQVNQMIAYKESLKEAAKAEAKAEINPVKATLQDPIALILTGASLIILTVLLVFFFIPKQKPNTLITMCRPTYFLFWQNGQVCDTKQEVY